MNIIKGWKTIGFNVVASIPILMDIVGQVMNDPSIQGLVPDGYMKYYAGALVIVNLVLRKMTTTPVGKKL